MEGPSSTTDTQASRKSGWDGEFQWQPLFWCHWHHVFLDISLSSSPGQAHRVQLSRRCWNLFRCSTWEATEQRPCSPRPCSPRLCSQQLGQWMDKKGQGVGPCLVLSGPDLLRGQMFAISSTRHGFHLASLPASWAPGGSVHTNSWPTPEVCLCGVCRFWSPLLGLLYCSLLFRGASPST